MRASSLWVPIVLAGALAGCSAESPSAPLFAKAAASGGDIAVTATIADADTFVAPALQIRSDGLGAYRNGSALTSIIQGSGAWLLDSYTPRNGTRRVYLDFSQPIAGSGPGGGDPVAVPSGAYRVRAISKCNLLGTTMQGLAPGASMPCPLHIKFDYAGTSYALQMNPAAGVDPYPETQYATVTCTVPASGAGPCTAWTITPSGTFVVGGATRYRNVAVLLKYVTVNRTTTAVSQGDFYVSFAIGVTNP